MIRFVRWLGLAIVLAAAAVLSFDALRSLALAVSIPEHLAWLLPVAVDAGAAVSCACWLSRDVPVDASRFARIQTWLLLGGTVIGNAGQLGMHAHGITPPWWVAVLVGAIPPAVVGGTVHLVVLLGRPDATQSTEEESTANQPDPAPFIWLQDEMGALDFAAARKVAERFRAEQSGAVDSDADEFVLPDRRAAIDTDNLVAICDDLRAIADRAGRPLTQDEVRQIYGIGSEKAGKARRTLGWWPRAVEQSDQSRAVAR